MNTPPSPQKILFDIATTDAHFEQIIKLQKENLRNALTKTEQDTEGFVYTEHTIGLVKKMATLLPQVIALVDNRVVGYNLALSPAMKDEVTMLVPMFNEFENCTYRGKPLTTYQLMVGGQVCVDKPFRGQGMVSKLYRETIRRLPAGYELCATEISPANVRSLIAHQKMGFEIIASYHDGAELWDIVVWDIKKLQVDFRSK
jgi:hypothetical protein